MKSLPPGLVATHRTRTFDENSLPAALRNAHTTKPGVWGVIRVLEGKLRYRILEPPEEHLLHPGSSGIVEPEVEHRVEPVGEVRFFVEFLRRPSEDDA